MSDGLKPVGWWNATSLVPRARARARRVVPISELVLGALTQNRSSLEPSLGFAAIARHAAWWIMHDTVQERADAGPQKVVAHQANLVPVPPLARMINRKGIAVLNARRAGSRGKSRRSP
jgi:hypothetical protein